MQWYNPPPQFTDEGDIITVHTGPKTDFWRITHYDFIRDDGHFYYQEVSGDFTLEVKVIGDYRDLYDQAGVMIRIDAENWIKTGIEFVDGTQYASVVVTRNYSDWSVVKLGSPNALWLRVIRGGDGIEIFYSLDGQDYIMMRLAYFPTANPIQVGVMCCSPQGEGCDIRFEGLSIR